MDLRTKIGVFGLALVYLVFFAYWTVYAFIIVPHMGDVGYYLSCLAAWIGMVFMPFPLVSPRPAGHLDQPRRRSRSTKPTKHHTAAEWRALVAQHNYRCLCCKQPGTPANPITKDHVIPRIKNGADTIDNIQPLCKRCNSRKGTKIIDYR
jgi:hypothetical protein